MLLDAGADPDVVNRNGATPLGLACAGAGAALVTVLLDAGARPRTRTPGRGAAADLRAHGSRRGGAGAAVPRRGHRRGGRMARPDSADVGRGREPRSHHERPARGGRRGGRRLDGRLHGPDVRRSPGRRRTPRGCSSRPARTSTRGRRTGRASCGWQSPTATIPWRRCCWRAAPIRPPATRRAAPRSTTWWRRGGCERRPQVPAAVSEGAALHATESLDLMRLLLEAGADPNARTEPQPRLTDARAQAGGRPAIDNQVNMGGATPYAAAARGADHEAMRLLAEHGADPRLATYANNTALTLAAGVVFTEGLRLQRPEPDILAAVRAGPGARRGHRRRQRPRADRAPRRRLPRRRQRHPPPHRRPGPGPTSRTSSTARRSTWPSRASTRPPASSGATRSAALLRELGAVSSRPAASADASP